MLLGISISLAILSEIFIQIGYFFYELYTRKQKLVFFSEHCVYLFYTPLYLTCTVPRSPSKFCPKF